MHILHVWDIAGVACVLSKELQKSGHNSKVIRYFNEDKFGIYKFYENYVNTVDKKIFLKKCLEEANLADILHFHGSPSYLLKIAKKLGNTKKTILHYHGSDIRGFRTKENIPHSPRISDVFRRPEWTARNLFKPWKKLNQEAQQVANKILVSSPDLLEDVPSAQYLPNPIDADHFKQDDQSKNEKKDALMIKTDLTDANWALNYCKKNKIDLNIEVYDREKNPIPYSDIPKLLRKYKIYVDLKYINGNLLTVPSNTALEALSCGLRVLNHKLNFIDKLPDEHKPKNVISKLTTIYSEI